MKTNVNILKSLLLLFMAATVMGMLSCTAEDGKDGVDGEDGISNIEVSEWFPIEFDHINGTSEYGWMNIEIPGMVEFVEDGGVVLMFFREVTNSAQEITISALPLRYDLITLTYTYGSFIEQYGHEGIVVLARDPNGVTIFEYEDFSLQYVMIPSSNGRSAHDFTRMSYEEVMDYFEIVN